MHCYPMPAVAMEYDRLSLMQRLFALLRRNLGRHEMRQDRDVIKHLHTLIAAHAGTNVKA